MFRVVLQWPNVEFVLAGEGVEFPRGAWPPDCDCVEFVLAGEGVEFPRGAWPPDCD